MLIDRVRRNGLDPAVIPASVTRIDGRSFQPQCGGAFRFLRIAIRCTADVIVQIQVRRNEMAARADIERLFANDPHLVRDIGLLEHSCEPAELVSAAPREQLWAFDRLRERP
jgi:hypothetical protein